MTIGDGVLQNGDRLPVLVLRRGDRDAERLRRHLRRSTRVDTAIVRPDALLRVPLRWPEDPRVQPLAMVVAIADLPGAVASVAQLVRRLGDVPLVVVADGPRDFAVQALDAGAEEVLESNLLSGPALEQSIVAAVTRRIRGVVSVPDVEHRLDLEHLQAAADTSAAAPNPKSR